MQQEFVHLHNHSEYSLLDGMLRITEIDGKPSKFLQKVAKQKIPALAITDHGNMYGAIAFYNNAIKVGVKPILGCELYITEGSRREKDKNSKAKLGHITALVKDNEGYQNLIEMLSKAHLEGFYYYPRIDFELLEKYHKGIIFLSGCLYSLLNQYILEDNISKAKEYADRFKSICGKDNFFIELMNHDLEDEKKVLKPLIEIAKDLGLGLVATNDCHFENKEDSFAHDVHICISTNAKLDDKDRLTTNQHLYYKSPQEMYELFKDVEEALKNTVEISHRCNFHLEKGKIYLPKYKVPDKYIEKYGDNEEAQFAYLKDLCIDGLKEKFGKIPEEYLKRLEYELGVIKNLGFSSYFLIVMDFISYARRSNIPVGPGRGSGAGSLVSYALNITKIDPLKHNLLFERFLNPGRKSMPDLDIDFSDKGREDVVNYVVEKYGKENVANIITYGTIMAKTAIKDAGRVLGLSASETNKITKLIANNQTLSEALQNPELQKLRDSSPLYKKLFDVATKIEGLKRHTGIHAAGKVITEKPVYKYTPLAQREGVITTQYDGETLTDLGLLKIDFLGLRTLSVIDDTVKQIKQNNPDFDIDKIPLDDPKTYKLLSEGKTIGVFQLESEGMQKLVRNLKPSVFSDISALVALYRPGPIEAGMIDSFVNRKYGREKIVYDHPYLEDILKDTYGTIIYQEQVMEIAKKLAGFSPAQADDLRKAMGKKIPEMMEKAKDDFIKGSEKNSIPSKTATKIFDQMYKFAGYGFNKSHSVAYAMIAYQTAYLKANYPLEFMISLLTSEIGHSSIGSEQRENKIVKYIEEANSLGYDVLPPDINKSYPDFSKEECNGKLCIRFALRAIKNIGENVAKAIVEEREKNGPYRSINDFISRNDPKHINKKVMEALAKAGAFDSLFDKNLPHNLKRTRALASTQNTDSVLQTTNTLFTIETEKVLTEHEILNNEKEVLGFFLSGNPLVSYRKIIRMIETSTIGSIINQEIEEEKKVRIVGLISKLKITKTKKNENMCKLELEDLSESIGVTIFPKTFESCKNVISQDKIIVVEGTVKKTDFSENNFEIIADNIFEIEDYLEKRIENFIIYFEGKVLMSEDQKELKEIRKILHSNSTNRGAKVYFVINSINHKEYILETNYFIKLKKDIIKKIEEIFGGDSWKIA